MVDERQDSIRQGISVPEESEIGRQAAEERRRRAAEGPEIGGGIGGTSDVDSTGDEATFSREQATPNGADAERPGGGG